jgi:hypothetical protein
MFLDSRREDKWFWTEWLAIIAQIQFPSETGFDLL